MRHSMPPAPKHTTDKHPINVAAHNGSAHSGSITPRKLERIGQTKRGATSLNAHVEQKGHEYVWRKAHANQDITGTTPPSKYSLGIYRIGSSLPPRLLR